MSRLVHLHLHGVSCLIAAIQHGDAGVTTDLVQRAATPRQFTGKIVFTRWQAG